MCHCTTLRNLKFEIQSKSVFHGCDITTLNSQSWRMRRHWRGVVVNLLHHSHEVHTSVWVESDRLQRFRRGRDGDLVYLAWYLPTQSNAVSETFSWLASIRMASEDVSWGDRMGGESETLASAAESRVSSDWWSLRKDRENCLPRSQATHPPNYDLKWLGMIWRCE